MKVLGYVRVSTAEQASNGESLETQMNQVRGYAMMKGWQVDDIFVERGVSGSIPLADRPEGLKLLEMADKGDMIITPKLDRMFRSASDALATLEELQIGSIGLHMIDLGGDVCSNGISKMVFTILSAVAENERDRIRERIRDVKRNVAARGGYNGGKVPFGFILVDGKLVKDSLQQTTIAEMRRLRDEEKKSYNYIGQALRMDMKTVKRILDRTASQ